MTRAAATMSRTLAHRGPDDEGTWVDPETGIALAHRRLSIIDLSPQGHQPMVSASGRYVLAYNGEIYNFRSLRGQLEEAGHRFRGHSDTEVLLSGVAEWGLEATLRRANGMFALALWDRSSRHLLLARDRVGKKPMYFGWVNGKFAFASELKAVLALEGARPRVDRNALALYLRYSYVPAPHSIYEGIYKLLPGTILSVTPEMAGHERRYEELEEHVVPYWSVLQVAEVGVADLVPGDDQEAVEQMDGLLREAVACRMVADVPLGALLSGGIDSSTVVALMQAQSSQPVRTFSIGFREAGYDEANHARAVADHLGTSHTELYVTPEEARSIIPKLPTVYDEPFADSSQIPTLLVSSLAREQVTVALSGDGGDELFGGYTRYFRSRRVWSAIGWMPRQLRGAMAMMLRNVPLNAVDRVGGVVGSLSHAGARQRLSGDRVRKLADVLSSQTWPGFYRSFLSYWHDPRSVVIGGAEYPTAFTDGSCLAELPNHLQQMMYLDQVTYLPDDILAKVDRASMAVSLEVRCPLLDQRVVEYAWRLPMDMKVREGQGKWLLRQVLYRYVPREMVERPKMGFGVPIDSWLRGPLREWAEELLSRERLERDGFFNPEPVREKWREHLSGKRNWQYHIWSVLMFQAWLDANRVRR